jgi:nicotinate-nucleotide adenylyltransferase
MTAAIGVYGGTFNPIHLGHLRAAEEVVEILGLERMLFVPSAQPPHKLDAEEVVAPAQARLAWTRLAVEDNPRFEVDAVEVERSGTSYSVDTLREIGERIAPELPVFAIGHDAFRELGSWREPEALLELAHFAVIARPPTRSGSLAEWLPASLRSRIELEPDGRCGRHRGAGTWIRLVEIRGLDVSSSEIRASIRQGRSTRYLLPDAVRWLVEGSGYYQEQAKEARIA